MCSFNTVGSTTSSGTLSNGSVQASYTDYTAEDRSPLFHPWGSHSLFS